MMDALPGGLKFSLATPKDAQELVDFHNSYYGTKRQPEHWLWEYFGNEPDKAVICVARDHGRLVATQGMIPIYLRIGNESLLTGKSENSLIMPTYRGSGIMQKLYEYAVQHCIERDFRFLWGFTGATKVFTKYGFTCFPTTTYAVRPGSIWGAASLMLQGEAPLWPSIRSAGKAVLESLMFRLLYHPGQQCERADYDVRVGTHSAEHDLQALYARLAERNKHMISIRLDTKYLQWRIRRHPFLSYDEFQIYQNGSLRAYAFVTLFRGTASISDLTSEDDCATSVLLDAVVKKYGKKAGRFRFFGNPGDYLFERALTQLRQSGFRLPRGVGNFCVWDISKSGMGEILDMRNWHINGLWTEGYAM